MSFRLMCPTALACLVLGCGEGTGPVEPDAGTAPVPQRSGPPISFEPIPFFDPLFSEICGFPIEVVVEGKGKTIFRPDGRVLTISPGLHVTFTNLDNGRTARVNATGPITETVLPDGSLRLTWNGRSLWAFPEDVEPQVLVLIGHFTKTYGPDGSVVQPLEGSGRILDACALIA